MEGGVSGWIERNRGKLGFLLGMPVGAGIYHLAKAIPEYIKKVVKEAQEEARRESIEYTRKAMEETRRQINQDVEALLKKYLKG
ncbi:MAG TPA: hypothetical protein ENG34_00345 [Candidatus Aenigmarchaeota archaeon]|nr:hypothetical protein [Candidatus Aenigmarchaeota archaeon]